MLAVEGTTTQSRSYSIVMTQFLVDPSAMKEVRARVVDAALALLTRSNTAHGVRAARVFSRALQGSIRGGEHRDQWMDEFVGTLQKLAAVVRTKTVPPAVLTTLAHSVAWHANYADGPTKVWARQIVEALDRDLRTLTISRLIDGHSQLTRHVDDINTEADLFSPTAAAVERLNAEFPDASKLLAFLESCLDEIALAHKNMSDTSPPALFQALFQESPALCRLVMTKVATEPKSALASFAGGALARLLDHDRDAAMVFVKNVLKEGDGPKLAWLGEAYWVFKPADGKYSDVDKAAFDALVRSNRIGVHWLASGMLRQVSTTDAELAFALLLKANLGLDSQVADRYLTWVSQKQFFSVEKLGVSGIEIILSKLENFDSHYEFWIQEFFKKVIEANPKPLVEFFLKRIGEAATGRSYPFQAVPAGPQRIAKMTITADADRWVIHILNWTFIEHQKGLPILLYVSELFELLFGKFDSQFVELLEGWATPADMPHFEVVLCALREANSEFAFAHQAFVSRLMRWAESLGEKAANQALEMLYFMTWRGTRAGRTGEPFPQDLELREKATDMLARLNKFEPACPLCLGIF